LVPRIRKFLVAKRLGPGDQLPSEPDLARQFGVATMTLRRAIALLIAEGVLERRHGCGTFVSGEQSAGGDLGIPVPAFIRMRKLVLQVETLDAMPHQLAFWREVAERFEQRYPGLSLATVPQPGMADPASQPVTGDVITLSGWHVPFYRAAGLLRPLARPCAAGEFHPAYAETQAYGVPLAISIGLILYNAPLARKLLGGEWSPVVKPEAFLSRLFGTIRTQRSVPPFAVHTPFPVATAAYDRIHHRREQLAAPETTREIFDLLAPCGCAHLATGRNQLFRDGQLAFMEETMTTMHPVVADLGFRYGVMPSLAVRPSCRRFMAVMTTVSRQSRFPEEAETLAHFLATPEIGELMIQHRYSIPPHRALWDRAFAIPIPGFADCRIVIEQGMPWDTAARDVMEYLGTVFGPISGMILNRKLSVAEGLERMRRQTELLHAGRLGWGKTSRRKRNTSGNDCQPIACGE